MADGNYLEKYRIKGTYSRLDSEFKAKQEYPKYKPKVKANMTN